MSWNATVPTTGSLIVDISSIHTQNWTAIEDFFGREHYTFTSPLSGRHSPGIVGALYSGTTAAITGISSPASGALAFDTTLGVMKTYGVLGAQWDQFNMLPYGRVIAYQSADHAMAALSDYNVIFDTETIDSLSEHSSSPYSKFNPKAAGYYLIHINLQVQPVSYVVDSLVTLYLYYGSSGVLFNKYSILSADAFVINRSAILYLSPSDITYFSLYSSAAAAVKGGSTLSYLNIYRMS